jgi:hypothetical protein
MTHELLNNTNSPVLTIQETWCVHITETSWLMPLREVIAVYCENHMKHINTLCGQTAEYFIVKADGTYILSIVL